MSKVKSPQEKKAQSLKRDRRNVFRENPAASRKCIRRGKQRSHMNERHAVAEILGQLRKNAEEETVMAAEAAAKTAILDKQRKAFKKHRRTAGNDGRAKAGTPKRTLEGTGSPLVDRNTVRDAVRSCLTQGQHHVPRAA